MRTDNFAAVNAYYHADRFFRLAREMGFDLNVYFGGTLFPTAVDHRGTLYNHVNGPNFGFAHSAGDSVAVVLNDYDTKAPDRFVSFPRHHHGGQCHRAGLALPAFGRAGLARRLGADDHGVTDRSQPAIGRPDDRRPV